MRIEKHIKIFIFLSILLGMTASSLADEGDPKYLSFCDGFGEGYSLILDKIYGSAEEFDIPGRPHVPPCPTHYYSPTGNSDLDFESGTMMGVDMAKKGLK